MDGLVYVGGYGPGISGYQRTGTRLSPIGTVPTADASFLAVNADRSRLYAVNELTDRTVSAFAIEDGGGLRPLGSQPTGGIDPCHLMLHPDGYLLTANYGSGSVSVHPILPDGSLGERTDLAQHRGSGPNPRQEGPHAHEVRLAGHLVVAVDLGLDRLIGYRLDPDTGRLETAADPFARTHPGAGPRHAVAHPRGRWYVADELDSTVSVFDTDPTTGVLHQIATVPSTLSTSDTENLPAGIALSADASRLYVSNRGQDSLVTFAVGGSGDLTAIDEVSAGGSWPRHFAIVDGSLFVANQKSNSVVAFALDPGTGIPRPTGDVIEVQSPTCVLPI
jgi:6-phosphogluconolactonase (cycloisomerase 2 family)